MTYRTYFLAILMVSFAIILFNAGIIDSVHAQPDMMKNGHGKAAYGNAGTNAAGKVYGKVTEIIDVNNYTYAEVDTGSEKVWAAGPTTPLKKGDMVAFTTHMPMVDFYSKSMERKFSKLYFIGRFITDKEPSNNNVASEQDIMAAAHGGKKDLHGDLHKKPEAKPITGIDKVEDGSTIAEVYANKADLKGQTIRLRGKVTKFSPEILGKNWLHIRDSSTLDDLTVTVAATAENTVAVDDIVIVEGQLELDKDYNYGYIYPVILENAKVTKE